MYSGLFELWKSKVSLSKFLQMNWNEVFFRFLEENRKKVLDLDRGTLEYIIKRSCEIKAEVVSKDERETGLRAILNYGHTIGHALETATGYSEYLHGEAVAIGMCCEARLASLAGLIDRKGVERVLGLISSYGLHREMPSGIDEGRILDSMQLDKKAVAGKLKFILPERVGSVRIETVANAAKIRESLRA